MSTNTVRGQRTVRIATTNAEKKGFTVALCALADGTKLPAMLIFKEKNGELGPRVKANLKIPANVVVAASTNGWMTSSLLLSWFRRVWGESGFGERRLLVLDSYRPHKSTETKNKADASNTDVVIIPG